MARRWRRVSMTELDRLWKALAKQGICYNGMTHEALVQRYGIGNLKHRPGLGWYKLTGGPNAR